MDTEFASIERTAPIPVRIQHQVTPALFDWDRRSRKRFWEFFNHIGKQTLSVPAQGIPSYRPQQSRFRA